MISKGSQVVEQPSWSSQSASPSPPPPPLPPPVVARWARTEQNIVESCAHCRGRLASLPTRTTSLSSYSACKDRSTPVPIARPHEDEDSFPVICDRELHSLHRNVPALRRRDVDTAAIRQHYYPEGGWGWLVCGAAFLAHLLTSGVQLAFGLLYLYTMKFLVKKNQEREFYVMAAGRISIEETCIFDFEAFQSNTNEISGDRKPFIQVETQISCENEKTVKISEKEIVETDSSETIENLQSISKETIKHMDGCGDRFKKVLSPITECLVESPQQQIELPLMNLAHSENGDYQKFSLDIIIESLVWRKQTTSKNFIFKFKHPKASTILAIKAEMENCINRNILLESVHCKLIYVTTSENIWHILQTWKPALTIEDKTGAKICKKHHFKTEELKGQREYSYVSSQMDGKDILVDLKIWMCLQTIDFAEIPKINYLLEPHILDDFLTLKELSELETWKKEVKDKFIEELKVKEKEQLDDLMKNWTERKNSLENKLITNINRCKILSKELQKSSSTLKVQRALQEKEQTTALEKIHDEVRKNAIKYSLNENYELLEKISDVERENANLKEMLVDLNEELNSMKKSSLSNQQTATLLQEVRCLEEKYMEAQKVKGYFKEQYAKAVKEIHQLKTEGQKTIQTQLQVKKEELSQLSLDKFFEMHHSDGSFNLNGDMLKPNVIRKKSCYPFRNAAEDQDEQVIMETIDYMNTL